MSGPPFAKLFIVDSVAALGDVNIKISSVSRPSAGVYLFHGQDGRVGEVSPHAIPGEVATPRPELCFGEQGSPIGPGTCFQDWFTLSVQKSFAVDPKTRHPREYLFVEIARQSKIMVMVGTLLDGKLAYISERR